MALAALNVDVVDDDDDDDVAVGAASDGGGVSAGGAESDANTKPKKTNHKVRVIVTQEYFGKSCYDDTVHDRCCNTTQTNRVSSKCRKRNPNQQQSKHADAVRVRVIIARVGFSGGG
jgi:hypothetical protein